MPRRLKQQYEAGKNHCRMIEDILRMEKPVNKFKIPKFLLMNLPVSAVPCISDAVPWYRIYACFLFRSN